jgi:CDGSH-type Zn-finger protein
MGKLYCNGGKNRQGFTAEAQSRRERQNKEKRLESAEEAESAENRLEV